MHRQPVWEEVDTPALLLDRTVLERNIRRMADFAKRQGVALRPHIKTHKSVRIARMQLEAGAVGITVAKLGEAEVMADAGIRDIRVAYEVVHSRNIRRLIRLIQREIRISCLIDGEQGAGRLQEAADAAGVNVDVLIEVDTGLRRCGVLPGEPAVALARRITSFPRLRFRGLLTHAGHAYGAKGPDEVRRIGLQEGQKMVETAEAIRRVGIPVAEVSVGSTPTAVYAGAVPGVTEIRPGNYVFHDRMQVRLGAARYGDCALKVLATVVSRPAPDRLVLDAGSKALALDQGAHGVEGIRGFGKIEEHPGAVIERLSEEHGVVNVPEDCSLQPGDRVEIIPNHACTAANLFDRYHVVERGSRVDVWPVDARGRVD